MNLPHDPTDPLDAEREWRAQERAMQLEREGGASDDDDPRVQRYRVLDRALRQPPADALPPDFAARIAAIAQRRNPRTGDDPRGERWLQGALCAVLALALIVLPLWRPAATLRIVQASPLHAVWQSPWPWLLAGCMAITLLTQWLGSAWVQRHH